MVFASFPALFLHEMAQLPLHRLEGVMHDFAQRVVRAVVVLFFLSDKLVTRRHRDIDPDAKGISLLMGVIWLLDGNVTTVDVIAEFVETRGVTEN